MDMPLAAGTLFDQRRKRKGAFGGGCAADL
jgi:hypothetical protein